MNNLTWLLRAARWVRHPPGTRRVVMVLAILAAGLVLVGLDHLGLWPDWARVEPRRGVSLPR